MTLYRNPIVFAALALLLLAGCQGNGSASAGQAAAQQIIRQPAGAAVDPTSIEVLQTQEFNGITFVVLSYQRMWNNRDEQCLAAYQAHYELFNGWTPGSGVSDCTLRGIENANGSEPIHVSSGTQSRAEQNKPAVSHVLGKVNDPAITRVKITWQDGQPQEAEVVNGSFLAIRSGSANLKTVEAMQTKNVD